MFNTDLPITKSEEDQLNRRSFADSLAKTLVQNSFPSSFTIGLYGPWGSGKTSLVNMVLESVEKEDDPNVVILRFNPWLCSDPKQLISQFFKQLSAALKMKKTIATEVCELMEQYAQIFDIGGILAEAVQPTVASLTTIVPKFLAKLASGRLQKMNGDLQERKNQITEKLKDDGIKIIVSIDDIDRLSEDEIIAVFQLVKALADFPNMVYLLTFDYDVVVHALSKVQHGDGKAYLEKIIQVPFEIPTASTERIQQIFFQKLKSIYGGIQENLDKDKLGETFQYGIRHYLQTIRDVVRYTNVYMLKYELLKKEADPVDLLILTALQVFEPSLYAQLPEYREALCGTGTYRFYEQPERTEKVKKVLTPLFSQESEFANIKAAKYLLGILFPETIKALGVSPSFGRTYFHRDFLLHKNIAAPECFDRYFAMTLEEDDIPAAVLNYILSDAGEKELADQIIRLYREGKIIRLLNEIEAYANQKSVSGIAPDRAEQIITALTRTWGMFEVDDRGSYAIPFNWRLLFCTDPLLRRLDPARRVSFIQNVFEDERIQVSTLSLMLEDFERQIGRYTEKNSKREDAVFSEKEADELEVLFKKRAIEAIDSGEALTQYRGLDFLWLLGKIDPEGTAKIKKSLITDDVSLIKVLGYCTSFGSRTDKTIMKTRTVHLKSLKEFIDAEEARRRVRDFMRTDPFRALPKNDQMNAVAFMLTKEPQIEEGGMVKGISDEEIEEELEK
mgnify:CR=1 FL=1